jgi:hypothetical protein
MADIFGMRPQQYQYLRAAAAGKAAGLPDCEQIVERVMQRHDFQALQQRRRINMAGEPDVLGYLTDNLEAVQSQIEEVLYAEFRLDRYIPIVTDIPEGYETYAYRIIDGRGDAGWLDNRGTGAGSTRVSQRKVSYQLEDGGTYAEWSRSDLRNSIVAGVPLDDYAIKHATRACKDHIEIVGIEGDTSGFYPFKGLINQTTGTTGDTVRLATQGNNQTFNDLTGDEMAQLVADDVSQLIEDSSEIIGRNINDGLTLYLPIAQHHKITTTRLPDSPTMSAWDWVKNRNQWTELTNKELKLEMVKELKGAGVGTGVDRLLLGLNTREIMEMAQPIMPRVLEVINDGFSYRTPLEYKISGLNVKRPIGLRYRDAI